MKKESVKPAITEYEFLRLYVATMVVQSQRPIITNHQLEKDLFNFYENPQYKFLFEDIAKKKDEIESENSYVDLSTAFQLAYAFGLLTIIQDSGNLKSVINFSVEEAKKIVSEFPIEQVSAMESMAFKVNELNSINDMVLLKREK